MEALSARERQTFLALYGYEVRPDSVPNDMLALLVEHGLLAPLPDGSYDFTEKGNHLYDELRPDEPYEGV